MQKYIRYTQGIHKVYTRYTQGETANRVWTRLKGYRIYRINKLKGFLKRPEYVLLNVEIPCFNGIESAPGVVYFEQMDSKVDFWPKLFSLILNYLVRFCGKELFSGGIWFICWKICRCLYMCLICQTFWKVWIV